MSFTGQRNGGFPFNPGSSGFKFNSFCFPSGCFVALDEYVWVSNLGHSLNCASLTHLQLVPEHWKLNLFISVRQKAWHTKERGVYSDSQGSPVPPLLQFRPVAVGVLTCSSCALIESLLWNLSRNLGTQTGHLVSSCAICLLFTPLSLKPLLIKLPPWFFSQSSEKAPNEH